MEGYITKTTRFFVYKFHKGKSILAKKEEKEKIFAGFLFFDEEG